MNGSIEQKTVKGLGGGAIKAMRDSIDMESLNSNRYNANKKKLSSKGKGTKRN